MSCCIFAPAKENLALLLRRVRDSKTNVRKAALQVLRSNRRRLASRFPAVCVSPCSASSICSDVCCSGFGGSPETRRDSGNPGEPRNSGGAQQRPGCVCEEEGLTVPGRTAHRETGSFAVFLVRGQLKMWRLGVMKRLLDVPTRPNQGAWKSRRRGCWVWSQLWWTLRTLCRIRLWRFWTRFCSVRWSPTLRGATWTTARGWPGTCLTCCVMSAGTSGQDGSLFVPHKPCCLFSELLQRRAN